MESSGVAREFSHALSVGFDRKANAMDDRLYSTILHLPSRYSTIVSDWESQLAKLLLTFLDSYIMTSAPGLSIPRC
jgi:hypothetical protein